LDCYYDTTSDQRRTSALKQKIDELARESSALKEIIGTICAAEDRNAAVGTASRLSLNGFQGVEAVAALLRSQKLGRGFGVVGDIASAGSAWPLGVSMPLVTAPTTMPIGPGVTSQCLAQSGWEIESSPESVDNKQWAYQDKRLKVSSRSCFNHPGNSIR